LILRSSASSASLNQSVDIEAQGVFLQCTQYFVANSMMTFCDTIEQIVSSVCASCQLGDEYNSERLEELLSRIRSHLDVDGSCRNLSFLIVPVSADATAFSHSRRNAEPLMALVHSLRHYLESELGREWMTNAIDMLLRECFVRVVQEQVHRRVLNGATSLAVGVDEMGQRKDVSMPLAKMLPIMTSVYHSLLTNRDEFDSPLQRVLMCTRLHMYCVQIFESNLI